MSTKSLNVEKYPNAHASHVQSSVKYPPAEQYTDEEVKQKLASDEYNSLIT